MSDGSASLRPLREDEYAAFLESSQAEYAGDMRVAGLEPDVAEAKSKADHAALLPDRLETAGHSVYAIDDDGEPAGYLWLAEREGDMGRNLFVYGVFVDQAHRGRGLGRAAMLFTEEEARRRGFPKVALNVFGGNDIARGLYIALGYDEIAVHMEKRV